MRSDQANRHGQVLAHGVSEKQQGVLVRIYSLTAFTGQGTQVRLRLDASSWGIGGTLYLDENPTAWFASRLDKHDEKF